MKNEGEAGGLALGFVGVLRFAEEGDEDLELAGREAFLGGAVLRFIWFISMVLTRLI